MNIAKEIHQVRPFRNAYHRATVNLIFTGKWIVQFHADLFKPYYLTLQQYNILRILRGRHPEVLTIKLIRERMLDRMSDASRIVEGMRKRGLLERVTHPSDRRRMDVSISQKGLTLLAEIDSKENEKLDNHLNALNEVEIEQLNFLLDKLRH